MSATKEARTQLVTMLLGSDFSPAFDPTYSGTKGVQIVSDWPMDLIQNMQSTNNGMMTVPVISVIPIVAPESGMRLGDNFGPGQALGTIRFARLVEPHFSVDCWADLQLGGGELVEDLGGLVAAYVRANAHGLTSYRQLTAEVGHLSFVDAAQLWHLPVTVAGRLYDNFDR